jgi:hypothetical protein
MVEELLDGRELKEITLLALDENERDVLHEALLHIIQVQK